MKYRVAYILASVVVLVVFSFHVSLRSFRLFRLHDYSTIAFVVDITESQDLRNGSSYHVVENEMPSVGNSTSSEIVIHDQVKHHRNAFVLHVGPMKTGSTTIQIGVKNKQFKAALTRARWVQLNAFDISSCFFERCDDRRKWNETFFDLLPSPQNTSVLLTMEKFSSVDPEREDIMEALSRLNDSWDLRVVVIYREFFSWLPSIYAQGYKSAIYQSRMGSWKTLKGVFQSDIRRAFQTFPDWFEDKFLQPLVENDNIAGGNITRFAISDSFYAYHRYRRLLSNKGRLIVLDLVDESNPAPFFDRFLKSSMPEVKKPRFKKKDPHDNTSDQFLKHFAGEEILTAAYHQGLLPKKFNHVLLRKLITERISDLSTLPRTCIRQEHVGLLWNHTLRSHMLLSSTKSRTNITSLREKFQASLSKMCSVDGPAVLALPEWSNFSSFVQDMVARKNHPKT